MKTKQVYQISYVIERVTLDNSGEPQDWDEEQYPVALGAYLTLEAAYAAAQSLEKTVQTQVSDVYQAAVDTLSSQE